MKNNNNKSPSELCSNMLNYLTRTIYSVPPETTFIDWNQSRDLISATYAGVGAGGYKADRPSLESS